MKGWTELSSSLACNNGLCDEDQTVCHVAEASKTEQLQVKVGPPDLVDGLEGVSNRQNKAVCLGTDIVDESHLRVECWINVVQGEKLSFNGIGVAGNDTSQAASSSMIGLLIAVTITNVSLGQVDLFLLCVGHRLGN